MKTRTELLVIGGSSGSLEVILHFLPELKMTDLPAILIVLHRKAGDSGALTDLLSSKTRLLVKEAEEKEAISPNTIYIAPADYHLLIEKDHTFSLDYSEKVNYSRPSIDITFQSASEAYGSRLAALLLSGANADGAEGLRIIKDNSGIAAVQDPSSAHTAFMPQSALALVKPDFILDREAISSFINSL